MFRFVSVLLGINVLYIAGVLLAIGLDYNPSMRWLFIPFAVDGAIIGSLMLLAAIFDI